MLDEGVARAYEDNGEEEKASLEQMGYVIKDGPGLHMDALCRDLVVVDPVEEEGQGLEEDQGGHDPVDPEHLL